MITVTAPSAAAADSVGTHGWINILDYGTLFDGSNFTVVAGNKYFGVGLPFQTNLYRIDMVLALAGDPLSLVQAVWPNTGDASNLSIVDLGNGLVRVFGAMPGGNYTGFDLRFYSHGTSYITFESVRVSTVHHTSTRDVGYIQYEGQRVQMSSPYNSASMTPTLTGGQGLYTAIFGVPNWYKYDTVYVCFQIVAENITSIVADVGGYIIEPDITYLQTEMDGYGNYFVFALVDVSNLPESTNGDLIFVVRGTQDDGYLPLYIHEVTGYVDVTPPSPLVYWFTSLFSKLGSWFDGVRNTVSTGFSNLANWLSSGFQSVVDKLDELINDSSDGTSEQIKDDLGSVGDFEDRYHYTVEGNWGDVSGSLDQVVGGSNFIGAASFYSDIVQTIFESVPDYGVVLTAVLCVSVVFSLL